MLLKKIKQRASLILTLIMLASILPSEVLGEEKKEFAQVIFGETMAVQNMSVSTHSMSFEQKDGRWGVRTNKAVGSEFVWLNLADSFMHNLPVDTPVDITVEYYDDVKGAKFGMIYDSHRVTETASTKEAKIRNETEMVYFDGSKEWKSYTFHLEDLYAGGRLSTTDIMLGVWTPSFGTSKTDVLFGSVKIEYSDFTNPMKFEGGATGRLGNMATAEEEIVIMNTYLNKSYKPINVELKNIRILDMDNVVIENFPDRTIEIAPRETSSEIYNVSNAKKLGTYTLKADTYTYYKETPEDIREEEIQVNFSRSYLHEPGKGSEDYGGMVLFVDSTNGPIEDLADVMAASGVTWTRADCPSLINSDGKWTVPESTKEKIRVLKEHGINVLLIVNSGDALKKGDRRWAPISDEELKIFGEYVKGMAEDLKGLVDHFDVWNEPDLATFNTRRATPEQFVKIYKTAYEAIKSVQPDSTVFAFSTAAASNHRVNLDFIERALKAGAYPYFDGVTIHPYDWQQYFRAEEWVLHIQDLKNLLAKYGGEKPIWSTELGFSTHQDSTDKRSRTLKRQTNNHILNRALSKGYDLLDVHIFYEYNDQARPYEIEDNWGIVKAYNASPETPFSAKPSFVAMSAFTHYINHNTEVRHNLSKDGVYVFDFYNNELGKNIAFLQTADLKGNVGRGLKLGAKSVELYDMYGNLKATLNSPDGVYHFSVDESAVYVVGDFTTFEEAEYSPKIKTAQTELSGVVGDTLKIDFTSASKEAFDITVSESVQVKENPGINNGTGSVSITVPDGDDGREIYGNRKVFFHITITDKNGNVVYCEEHSVEILKPVEVQISSEVSSPISKNYWNLKVNIKNLRNEREMAGTIEILAPEDIAKSSKVRVFEQIGPNETGTFIFNLPEKVNKSPKQLEVKLTLDDGYTETFTRTLDFTSAVYAAKKPTIDGVITPNEWGGSWIGAEEKKDVDLADGWEGPDDLSFSGTLMWDEDNMYFAIIARDDIHYVDPAGDISRMWATDGIQFAVDDTADINPMSVTEFEEVAIAELAGQGEAKAYRHLSSHGRPVGEIKNMDIAVKRYDTYTVYECCASWDELFGEGYELNTNLPFRFAAVVNDHDGNDEGRGLIAYAGGISPSKNLQLFSEVVFSK